jgi:hypothetical protein
MIANPARTPANPAAAGMIYSPAFRKLPSGSEEVRFALDSLVEGGGFEPSVPPWRMAPGPASAELREVPAGQFAVRP